MHFWSGAEEEERQQEVLQSKTDMHQQQLHLAEQGVRLTRQEDQQAAAVSAKEDELRARSTDLDRRETSLKHGQENLSAGQAQLAKGRHVLHSVWAGIRTCNRHACLKYLVTGKLRSLLFHVWYLWVHIQANTNAALLMNSTDLQKARHGSKKRNVARPGCGSTRAC